MALEQWNAKIEEGLKQRLEQLNTEFDSKGKMLETILDIYQMQKIKTGEIKDVEKATIDAISGDFSALDDLTRAVQRVFLGMVEKLGYREAEAVKEAGVLKTRIDSLLQQHAAEIKTVEKEKEDMVQLLEKMKMEFTALQKDAALFEEKEKNLTEKLQKKEEESEQRLNRIGELDTRISELEKLAEENRTLQAELDKKNRELEKAETDHQHAVEVAELKHAKSLAEKERETKEIVAAEFERKNEELRTKWEEQSEKRITAAREDERKEREKRVAEIREQTNQELERVKKEQETEMAQLNKKYTELLTQSNKLKETLEKEKAKNQGNKK